MSTILTDSELFFLFMTILFAIAIVSAVMCYIGILYRQKQIVYPLFAARDAFINCVATGAVNKDDPMFKMFYAFSNDLIKVAHTDFFSINKYVKQLQKYENDEKYKLFSKNFTNQIKKRPEQFQQAVDQFSRAMISVFIEKNIMLKIILRFAFFAGIIKITWKFVNGYGTKTNRKLIEQKNYYDEVMKINNFRQNLNLEPVY